MLPIPEQYYRDGNPVFIPELSRASALPMRHSGKDHNLSFTPLQPDGKILDVDFLDEGTFVDGKWVTTRRLNGDEGTGGGDYGFGFGSGGVSAALKFRPSTNGDYSIVKFNL